MNKPSLFEIVEQNTYSINLKPIENIEECGDEFISQEELDEMGMPHMWGGTRLFDEKIKTALQEFVSSIKKDQKSIIITDQELIDVLTKNDRAVSDYVPNTRRVGNRLFKHQPKQESKTEVKYNDWSNLMHQMISFLNDNRGMDMSMRLTYCSDREQCVVLFKKMISWKELTDFWATKAERNQPSAHDQEWMKKVYDDPSLVPNVKKADQQS